MARLEPSVDMSKAIIDVLNRYASAIKGLDDETVMAFAEIVTAFAYDLQKEADRRG